MINVSNLVRETGRLHLQHGKVPHHLAMGAHGALLARKIGSAWTEKN